MNGPRSVAEDLNHRCDCAVRSVPDLHAGLGAAIDAPVAARLAESHPHLFSESPVFVDSGHVADMRRLIETVHRVVALPGYQAVSLAMAPSIAAIERPALGAFMGFDFHVGADGPRLIEINTNAGGALLNATANTLQDPCCEEAGNSAPRMSHDGQLADEFIAMFKSEWHRSRGDVPLRTIAIVDDHPESQYLYPEFLLFRRLFERHGIEALIVDAAELEFSGGELVHGNRHIDLVYNRVTDFYFEEPRHAALRLAYEADAAVITPHPRAHALFANKRNLALLTDVGFLANIGADATDVETLNRLVPRTVAVRAGDTDWWEQRKRWFFKPHSGFGSRGAYRGDKLTRGVFADIVQGNHVAQALTPPGARWRTSDGQREAFKFDIRAYTYAARPQLLVARLYQGQTTNFRTRGGGFAPVFESSKPGS